VPCLEKLAQYELLRWDDARDLSEAYAFLRRLEHRLQMEQNLQTHTHSQRAIGPGAIGAAHGVRDVAAI
jgi:glutamine synthetase adenylyltransferase